MSKTSEKDKLYEFVHSENHCEIFRMDLINKTVDVIKYRCKTCREYEVPTDNGLELKGLDFGSGESASRVIPESIDCKY